MRTRTGSRVRRSLGQTRRLALICLTVVAVAAIVGIVVVRVETGAVPAGLVGIASVSATGLVGATMAGVSVRTTPDEAGPDAESGDG